MTGFMRDVSCMPRSRPMRRGNQRNWKWPTRCWDWSARWTRSAAGTGRCCLTSTSGAVARKRGKPRRPWPSDRLQVIAYAALIAVDNGQPVAEGRIRYHADNTTVRVPFDDAGAAGSDRGHRHGQAAARIDGAAAGGRERAALRPLLARPGLPAGGGPPGATTPSATPLRLFPPDRDGTSLHVVKPGAHIGRSGESLVVHLPDDTPDAKRPIRELESVLLHGYAQITTQAINLCTEHDVAVHWLTTSGRHVASLTSTAGQVQRRLRQYRALADEATCLRLAKALARAKIEGQHRYLLRTSRGDEHDRESMLPHLVPLRSALASIDDAPDRDSLRGFEGSAAVGYFPGTGPAHQPRPFRNRCITRPAAAGRRSTASTRCSVSATDCCTPPSCGRSWLPASSRRLVFSTRRGARRIRWCST